MVNVELSYGPMLIGTYANMILYGILIVQALFYFQNYKRDASWIRYLVLYLFIAETVNTGSTIAIMYQPLILEYGRPVVNFPLMFLSEPAMVVSISTPIQLFFAWRIYRLTKSMVLPIIVSLFALVSLGGGIWTTIMMSRIKLFKRKPELHEPALVWFLSSCVSDVLITAALVISLSKRRTGFAATDDAISKIIRMTVQTGLLTALFAIGDVVFFLTLPHTGLNFIWDLSLSKLYSNCLLSTLNARASYTQSTSSISRPPISAASGDTVRNPGDAFLEMSDDFQKSYIELDTPRWPRRAPSAASSPHSKRPAEYGITVTKVVETSRPHSARHATNVG